jgi:hypothetical protein
MTVARSIALFLLAALAEIGGAWLIWQGWREHRGMLWIAAGLVALSASRSSCTPRAPDSPPPRRIGGCGVAHRRKITTLGWMFRAGEAVTRVRWGGCQD